VFEPDRDPILLAAGRQVAGFSSPSRLPDSSTPRFNERTGNVYENKQSRS